MPRQKKPDHSSRAHAKLPPSSSDKWLHCWGWLATVQEHHEEYGVPESSPAALEGTEAHEVFEQLIRGVPTVSPDHALPKTKTGRKIYADAVNHPHAEALSDCHEWVLRQEGLVYPELRVDFGAPFGYVGLEGTCDVTILHPEFLKIADLKFGRGLVGVEDPEGTPNSQLMCYLLGAINLFGEREKYSITVMQPRAGHPKGPIRERWVTKTDLSIFKYDLEKAVDANFSRKYAPSVGPWCRKFCDAIGSCKAQRNQSLQMMKDTPL